MGDLTAYLAIHFLLHCGITKILLLPTSNVHRLSMLHQTLKCFLLLAGPSQDVFLLPHIS